MGCERKATAFCTWSSRRGAGLAAEGAVVLGGTAVASWASPAAAAGCDGGVASLDMTEPTLQPQSSSSACREWCESIATPLPTSFPQFANALLAGGRFEQLRVCPGRSLCRKHTLHPS